MAAQHCIGNPVSESRVLLYEALDHLIPAARGRPSLAQNQLSRHQFAALTHKDRRRDRFVQLFVDIFSCAATQAAQRNALNRGNYGAPYKATRIAKIAPTAKAPLSDLWTALFRPYRAVDLNKAVSNS